MKRTRHRPEQIIMKLRDADGMLAGGRTIGEVCQALGISEPTFQRWRQQYGGMKAEPGPPSMPPCITAVAGSAVAQAWPGCSNASGAPAIASTFRS